MIESRGIRREIGWGTTEWHNENGGCVKKGESQTKREGQ